MGFRVFIVGNRVVFIGARSWKIRDCFVVFRSLLCGWLNFHGRGYYRLLSHNVNDAPLDELETQCGVSTIKCRLMRRLCEITATADARCASFVSASASAGVGATIIREDDQ